MNIDFKQAVQFLKTKKVKYIIVAFCLLIAMLLVFKAGKFVGERRVRFSYDWAENYQRNFAGPRGGFMRDMMGRDYINAHGIFGTILQIDNNTLVIKGQGDKELTVVTDGSTVMKRGVANILAGDLKIDDRVTIIGRPDNQGQIVAKLIRVF